MFEFLGPSVLFLISCVSRPCDTPPAFVDWQPPAVVVSEPAPSTVFNWPAPPVAPSEPSPATVFAGWVK